MFLLKRPSTIISRALCTVTHYIVTQFIDDFPIFFHIIVHLTIDMFQIFPYYDPFIDDFLRIFPFKSRNSGIFQPPLMTDTAPAATRHRAAAPP